jgi:hypothetical protein
VLRLRQDTRGRHKLMPPWEVPFVIAKVLKPGTYKLANSQGGQGQRSRRQPSLRPIRGQRENPLSRREDDAPVFRSSNGSRTRNGRPTNRTPCRINSAAGQAAPLAGEASNASPSP